MNGVGGFFNAIFIGAVVLGSAVLAGAMGFVFLLTCVFFGAMVFVFLTTAVFAGAMVLNIGAFRVSRLCKGAVVLDGMYPVTTGPSTKLFEGILLAEVFDGIIIPEVFEGIAIPEEIGTLEVFKGTVIPDLFEDMVILDVFEGTVQEMCFEDSTFKFGAFLTITGGVAWTTVFGEPNRTAGGGFGCLRTGRVNLGGRT